MTQSADTSHEWLAKAEVLTEALPFMRRYSGHKVVVKFGGHAIGDSSTLRHFADDMVLLRQVGACPIVVHGGGPQINAMLKKLNIECDFIDGLRITDSATVSVAEMVLSGTINKEIVSAIHQADGLAVGLSGKDGGLIEAQKYNGKAHNERDSTSKKPHDQKPRDLGFVGRPTQVNTAVMDALIEAMMIPVIAPIAMDKAGNTFNINADTVAGAISAASRARRLLMLTDIGGVLDKDGTVIPELTVSGAKGMIADGVITGGMIPKVETCIQAVERGTKGAVILDGRIPHSVLVELFTEHGIGTIITPDGA